jgi:hypothetical protein
MKKSISIVLLITAVILVGAALILLIVGPQNLMARMMGGAAAPQGDLDTATTRLSDQGLFEVTYNSSVSPIPINQIQTWTIHVETSDGQPVEQAEITVDGGMPQHGHGLPTQPQVTDNLGEGNFLVEGLKFQMPGWWEVTFHINANGKSDSITFNLVLN